MSQEELITTLLGIPGWKVGQVHFVDEEVVVSIERVEGAGYRCRGCGGTFLFCYDHEAARRIRDFPIWGRRCYLEFSPARVGCSRCGVLVEALDWIEPNQRQTLRYEKYVARLCDILPVLDVAELESLDKGTVYRLDRKWLGRREAVRPPMDVRYLGIDEIAVRRGQKYATVFYDLEKREVIALVKGRKQRNVSSLFRRLGKTFCKGVLAVCMDLWSAYLNSVRRHCKKAVVVFDKFHVYGYLSKAVEEVRRAEQSKAEEEGKTLIKGARWLLLRKTLGRKQRHTLSEILALNENLQKAHLLKGEFEGFYGSGTREQAEAFLADWTARCEESGLAPFRKLAKRFRRWKEGIMAFFAHPITNAFAEGINNTIKVIKRRSYGFHDLGYFFLKILSVTGALPSLENLTHSL
jgi:transposase